jgi:hypothetical protein
MVMWQADGSHDDVPFELDLQHDHNVTAALIRRREELKRTGDTRELSPAEKHEVEAIRSILAREAPTVKIEPKYTDGKSEPTRGGLR